MSSSQVLKVCRLLVMVLLLNMIAPMAMANQDGPNTVLICSSAGLIEVVLDDLSDANKNVQTHTSEHCPFCHLNGIDGSLNANKPTYPAPDTDLALNYLSVAHPSPAKVTIKHALMRAPPVFYL